MPERIPPFASRLIWLPVLLGLLSFAYGVNNDFIYDDNVLLRERLSADVSVSSLWTTDYWADGSGLYRPVTLLALRLELGVFGLHPAGFHIVSLLLHAAAAGLVFLLLARLVSRRTALATSCLFALHPIHAEAVLPAYGQADLLAGLFVLFVLERVTARGGASQIPLAVAAALLAMLCKETGLLAVPLAWLCLAYPREPGGAWSWRPRGPVLWLLAPAVVYFAVRVPLAGGPFVGDEAAFTSSFSLADRAKLVVISLAEYIRLCFAPWNQTPNYAHLRDVLAGPVWVEGAVIALAAIALWWMRGSLARGIVLFTAAWFLIGVLPILNIVPIGTLVAERSLYLPSVAATLVIASAIAALRVPAKAQTALLAVACVLALGLSTRLAYQWRDEISLWRTVTAEHPRSPQAHAFLGGALLLKLDPDAPPLSGEERRAILADAKLALRQALALNRSSATAWRGLGVVALVEGDTLTAVGHLTRSDQLRPNDPRTQRYLKAAQAQLSTAGQRRTP